MTGSANTPGFALPNSTFPGFTPVPPVIFPPQVSTISAPFAPPPQQYTNVATLINSQRGVVGIWVFRNGLLQVETIDYTRNGGLVTWAIPPNSTDVLTVMVFVLGKQLGGSAPRRYVCPWSMSLTGAFDSIGTIYNIDFGPTIFGVLDGVNGTFTLGVTLQRMQIFRNGLLQTAGVDVYSGPNAVTFSKVSIPQPGDIITVLGY